MLQPLSKLYISDRQSDQTGGPNEARMTFTLRFFKGKCIFRNFGILIVLTFHRRSANWLASVTITIRSTVEKHLLDTIHSSLEAF